MTYIFVELRGVFQIPYSRLVCACNILFSTVTSLIKVERITRRDVANYDEFSRANAVYT